MRHEKVLIQKSKARADCGIALRTAGLRGWNVLAALRCDFKSGIELACA
jgi:hypothetical protein